LRVVRLPQWFGRNRDAVAEADASRLASHADEE
jgi:hypothetical protein